MIQLTSGIVKFLNDKGFYQFYHPHMWKRKEWSDISCLSTEEIFKILAKQNNKNILTYLSENGII